ncbi:MAG: zinc-dependent metalloprotease family protein [Pseudomonadota bacterium]
MQPRRIINILLSLLFIFLFLPFTVNAAQHRMFTAETVNDGAMLPPPEKQGLYKAATRTRKVNLLPLIAQPDGLAKNDTLLLPLFSNADYTATIDRITTDVNGTVTVRGRVNGFPLGYVLISSHKGQSLATISIPELGKQYAIQFDSATQAHYLMEIDPSKTDKLEGGPSLTPPTTPKKTQTELLNDPLTINEGTNDPATINVMIIYTPAAKTWADTSGGGINNVIAQSMAKAQLVLDNSNTLVTMQLALAQEVSYTESGTSSTDLTRLTSTSDGYMDVIHGWRDTYGADLVALFTYIEDTGGLGWLLNSTSGSPAYAFCINRVQQVGWTYTQIHEMGHNMGLHHHKEQLVQPGPGLYSYSAGWRWTGTDSNRYCDAMTYENGTYFSDGLTHTRVAYFSSPTISYMGVATGDTENGDNTRNILEIKHVIAAYRNISTYTLNVNSNGASNVAITGSPATYSGTTNYIKTGIASGTSLTLTAPSTSGTTTFSSWTGCNSTSGNTCTVSMTSSKTVTANYTTSCYGPMVGLTVGSSAYADSICNGYYQQYSFSIVSGRQYKVTVTPSSGDPDLYLHNTSAVSNTTYTYSSTSGGTDPDIINFTAGTSGSYYAAVYGYASGTSNYSIKVEDVTPISYTLTVNSSGATSVAITGSPTTYTGTTNYSKTGIPSGTSLTLTAPASSGVANFSSWTGCTSTSGTSCSVTMTGAKTVTANYTTPSYTLTANSTGATGVAITGSPTTYTGTTNYSKTGIPSGTSLTLTAPASSGVANFSSWTGCTSTSGTSCSVTMTGAKTVTANYTTPSYTKSFPWHLFLPAILPTQHN